jgi:phage terminase small subunit
MSANRKLTPKQDAFCQELMVDMNATQAAIRAGFSPRNASRIGAELLGKTHVASFIAAAKAERAAKVEISAERVIREIARAAFLDIGKVFNEDGSMKLLSEIDEDTRRAIAGIEVTEIRDKDGVVIGYTKKLKFCDKLTALSQLCRHIGLSDKKVTVKANGDSLNLLIQAVQGSAFMPVGIDGDKPCVEERKASLQIR